MIQLSEAIRAVGDAYGTKPDCAGVAALLKLTAGHLGYDLTPRPVALRATHIPSEQVFFMGPRATALIPESAKGRVEDLRPASTDTGHMVLTMNAPEKLMIDANLRQLGSYGVEAPSLVVRVQSTTPESGEWKVALEAFDMVLEYFLDDNAALMGWYEEALVKHTGNALLLAEMVGSGMSSAEIGRRLTWRSGA